MNTYVIQTEQPLEGQFIAIWEYKGNLWSYTLRYGEDGYLEQYVADEVGAFVPLNVKNLSENFDPEDNIEFKFIVIKSLN